RAAPPLAVADVALTHPPGPADAGGRIKTDNFHWLAAAVGIPNRTPAKDQFLAGGHGFDPQCQVERKLNLALRVKGVASGEKLIFGWSTIRNPDGGSEQVEIVGFNPDTGIGGPWAMREGDISAVKGGLHAIVDES